MASPGCNGIVEHDDSLLSNLGCNHFVSSCWRG
ncbi:MAG: hypothetical protein ACI8UO_002392, partial [Verrucomicrobiales bacterium]